MLHRALEDGDFDSLSQDDWNQTRLYEIARMVRLEDVSSITITVLSMTPPTI